MVEGTLDGTIRHARVDETDLLTELTWRAVTSWGYDAGFMAWAPDALSLQATDE